MRKVKFAFWLLLLAFIGLVIYQNKAFFLAKKSFFIDLFFKSYHTPALPIAVLMLACFVVGLLIAYFFSLYGRFRANKTIKNLNATIAAQTDEIANLKDKLVATPPPPEASPEGEAPADISDELAASTASA